MMTTGCDKTFDILSRMRGLKEVVPAASYVSDERAHFTFPTRRPNRRLDYLFVDQSAQVEDYAVVQTVDYSDHRPLVARLALGASTLPR